jgi:hypothetical protein
MRMKRQKYAPFLTVGDKVRDTEADWYGTVVAVQYNKDARDKAYAVKSVNVLFNNSMSWTVRGEDLKCLILIAEAKGYVK